MSLTTTTVRNLGSFEIVTTKTTPIRAKQPTRKKYASSVLSYESDLDSVLEEDSLGNNRRAQRHYQQHKSAFARVDETIQASIPEKHHPPDHPRPPSKPSLKSGRPSSLRSIQSEDTESQTSDRRYGSRVSFSNQTSAASLSKQLTTTPVPKRKQYRMKYIKRDEDDSDDSDSGNSVYSDASEYLPMPNILGVVQGPNPVSKPKSQLSTPGTAAAAAAMKHSKPAIKTGPSVTATAAARSSVARNTGVPAKLLLTESAMSKHNGAQRGSFDPTERMSDVDYLEDQSDIISMNSNSSWQPRAVRQSKMGVSMRAKGAANGTSTGVTNGTGYVPLSAPSANGNSRAQRRPKPNPRPPVLKNPGKDYSQFILKRTPSNSSFEKEREKKGKDVNSAFKMMTLRAPRQPQVDVTPVHSADIDSASPEEKNGGKALAAASGSPSMAKLFKSRFLDSDSEEETPVEPPSPQQNIVRRLSHSLRPRGFSQSGTSEPPQLEPVVFDRRTTEEPVPAQPASPTILRRLSSSIHTRVQSNSSTSPSDVNTANIAPMTPVSPASPTSTASKPKKKRFSLFSRSKNQEKEVIPPVPVSTQPLPEVPVSQPIVAEELIKPQEASQPLTSFRVPQLNAIEKQPSLSMEPTTGTPPTSSLHEVPSVKTESTLHHSPSLTHLPLQSEETKLEAQNLQPSFEEERLAKLEIIPNDFTISAAPKEIAKEDYYPTNTSTLDPAPHAEPDAVPAVLTGISEHKAENTSEADTTDFKAIRYRLSGIATPDPVPAPDPPVAAKTNKESRFRRAPREAKVTQNLDDGLLKDTGEKQKKKKFMGLRRVFGID